MAEAPLISVILFSYNQEVYIEEAIDSLLKQTYSPLQIIISDDCSGDGTFELSKKAVEQYEGPHEVLIRRNANNLGIGKHVAKLLSLTQGEYIFLAAGDDISMPNRIQEVYDYWVKLGSSYKAIFGNLLMIDSAGESKEMLFNGKPKFAGNLEEFKQGVPCWAVGASLAIHRSLFDKFGSFESGVFQEDGCLAFRAILEGRFGYLDDVTVKYRFHDNNVSQNLSIAKKIAFKHREHYLWKNYLKDALISNPNDLRLISILTRKERISRITGTLLSWRFFGYSYFFIRDAFKLMFR